MSERNHDEHPPATPRLTLRRLTESDAPLMLAIWNDPDFVRHVGDRGIRELAEAENALRERVLRLYSEYGYGPYAMELTRTGELIGICGLFRRDGLDEPDIGFAVLPDFRGLGYVQEAARAVLDFALEHLMLPRLLAIVSPANSASVAIIRKLGLEFERMQRMPGDDEDVAVYGLTVRRTEGV
jgi:RimJ/RimL family protein N-acetyltransferase